MDIAKPEVKSWSDPSILKSLKNPSRNDYVIHCDNPEVTFLGATSQPDFAVVHIECTPGEKIIELKSLKMYFGDFRQRLLSYERLINVIFDDLWAVYAPKHLKITMKCNARGGISSKLVVDSKKRGDT